MKPYNQFTSGLQNFRATLIDENNIGCDFVFNIYDLNTNLRVGRYDASMESFTAFGCDTSQTANQLRELASLCNKVKDGCLLFMEKV